MPTSSWQNNIKRNDEKRDITEVCSYMKLEALTRMSSPREREGDREREPTNSPHNFSPQRREIRYALELIALDVLPSQRATSSPSPNPPSFNDESCSDIHYHFGPGNPREILTALLLIYLFFRRRRSLIPIDRNEYP